MEFHVHNPHNKPVDELPVIYGFNNGGSPGWYYGHSGLQAAMKLGRELYEQSQSAPQETTP